jgi:hypothetical protein
VLRTGVRLRVIQNRRCSRSMREQV